MQDFKRIPIWHAEKITVMTVSIEEIRRDVAVRLSAKRWRHCQAVGETAATLAEQYRTDPSRALIAGILHDYAREIAPDELVRLALQYGIPVDEIEAEEPVLLHGPVGAAIAKERFDVVDEEILQSISLHITGAPGMPLLAKLVFLADFIEPGREHLAVAKARELAGIDLAGAMLFAYDAVMRHAAAGGYHLHPRTVAAYEELIAEGLSHS